MARETLQPPVKSVEIGSTPESIERYRMVDAGTVAIFGEEGAGKSNLAEALALALSARLLQGGQIMREMSGGTHGTIGYLERPLSVDKNFDHQQIDMMIEATPDNPLIDESRLAGFLATTQLPEEIKIVRINVT